MNLVLIGYRGTGKSTVGRHLAELLDRPFVDADDELERRAGRTIREIFATDGEGAFRDLESQVVADLLTSGEQIVALGGGAILRPENRAIIRGPQNRVIWLAAEAESINDRIHRDAATWGRRPNLTALGGLAEIQNLLQVREPLYRECAEYIVDTEAKSPEQVAAEIVSLLSA